VSESSLHTKKLAYRSRGARESPRFAFGSPQPADGGVHRGSARRRGLFEKLVIGGGGGEGKMINRPDLPQRTRSTRRSQVVHSSICVKTKAMSAERMIR